MSEETGRRDRGTGYVYARGRMAWIQWSERGIKMRESTGITIDLPGWEKKARRVLLKKTGEVLNGIRHEDRQLRYEDLRDMLIRNYKLKGYRSLRFDREGNPYLDKVKRLDDYFSRRRASEIDEDMILKFMEDQRAKGLSNGSINRSLSALRTMFRLARKNKKLQNIPTFETLNEDDAIRKGFLEPGQYEALFQALPDYLRLPLAIGYFTGMRLGEILRLEWEQVDFLAAEIHLRAGQTKNGKARTIPIVSQLRVLLVQQHSRRQPGCALVCYRSDRKGNPGRIGNFRKAWYRACVKAGLGKMEALIDADTGKPVLEKPRGLRSKPKSKMIYRGTIFHDLRRTAVRNLVRAGVTEKIAMTISGHITRDVFERYNIVSPNDVAEAGRKLAAFHNQKFGHNSDTVGTEMQQADSSTRTM